jgi:hypothetical protein
VVPVVALLGLLVTASASAATCRSTQGGVSTVCGVDFSATAGQPFEGEVGSYSGLQSAQGHVTIDWGDGASSGGTRTNGIITGTHTYPAAGTYTVTVSDPVPNPCVDIVCILNGGSIVAQAAATVASAPVTAAPPAPPAPPVPTAVPVVITGSEVYGSDPRFRARILPPGDGSFTGTVTCLRLSAPATTISSALAPGRYTIAGSSCSGLALTGSPTTGQSLSYDGSTFTVTKAPARLSVASKRLKHGALVFAATLTAVLSRTPIAGAPLVLTEGRRRLCLARTNRRGTVICHARRPTRERSHATYLARFAGNADYVGTTQTFRTAR